MIEIFKKLPITDLNKLNELLEFEKKYSISISDEFKQFYSNHDNKVNYPINFGLRYRKDGIKNYCYPSVIIGDIYGSREMETYWWDEMQNYDFITEKGVNFIYTLGSAYIVLVADPNSINFEKVVLFDYEMADGEVFILANSFNEFLESLEFLQD